MEPPVTSGNSRSDGGTVQAERGAVTSASPGSFLTAIEAALAADFEQKSAESRALANRYGTWDMAIDSAVALYARSLEESRRACNCSSPSTTSHRRTAIGSNASSGSWRPGASPA
jgi:hypothetical protein